MSSRPFQGYTLFQMLKSANGGVVSRADIAKELGVNEGSVPIYFFGLKKFFGVDFEVVKNGRAVTGYRLLNGDSVDVPANGRRTSAGAKPVKAAKVAKVKKAKPVMTKVIKVAKSKPIKDDVVDVSDMEIEELTDLELSDIKSQLGLA